MFLMPVACDSLYGLPNSTLKPGTLIFSYTIFIIYDGRYFGVACSKIKKFEAIKDGVGTWRFEGFNLSEVFLTLYLQQNELFWCHATTFSIKTLSIKTFIKTTLSIETFSKTTLSKMDLIVTLCYNEKQHNDNPA
jgi:hypothetical protein